MTRKDAVLKHFQHVDPVFYSATKVHHTSLPLQVVPKKTRAQLFESLVSIVISQQLGTSAAEAISVRVKKVCKGRLTPRAIMRVPKKTLRTAGLSGAKIKTLKSIASAVTYGKLNLLSLKTLPENEAVDALMKIWGLGPWSVEMFLMFALGRTDVFSPGDLGLIRAMETIYKLPRGTPRGVFLAIAEKWSPHRTYASLLLWRTRDTKKKTTR